jgi:biotin transport system substrate-specific component
MTLASFVSVRWLPHVSSKVRDLGWMVLGALWVALFAQVRIPLPFTPVPITGQTFAVLLVGAALGAGRGAGALMLYLLMGMTGLPVFAGGAAGLFHLTGPTGGYLLGFVIAAAAVGRMAEHGWERSFRTSLIPFSLGTLLIYLVGVPWLALYVGPQAAIQKGLLPFLPGDLIKLLLAALALPSAWRLVQGKDRV